MILPLLAACLQGGLLNKVDGVAIHIYRSSNPKAVFNNASGHNDDSLRN